MAVTFEQAPPVVLSNRSVATAVIASTLGWSIDFFDLLILAGGGHGVLSVGLSDFCRLRPSMPRSR
jgi:hypothetical protein